MEYTSTQSGWRGSDFYFSIKDLNDPVFFACMAFLAVKKTVFTEIQTLSLGFA